MTYLENWGSGARRIIDACQAQGVEAPTWCSDGGFVTITFKRPDFKSDTIKIDHKGKDAIQKTDSAEENPSSTPQVAPKHPSSRITNSKDGRFLHDHERNGRSM